MVRFDKSGLPARASVRFCACAKRVKPKTIRANNGAGSFILNPMPTSSGSKVIPSSCWQNDAIVVSYASHEAKEATRLSGQEERQLQRQRRRATKSRDSTLGTDQVQNNIELFMQV